MNTAPGVGLTTYQGLTGALKVHSGSLLPCVQRRLQTLMERAGNQHWRTGGPWLPLAVDGSRTDTPRTKSNEAAFAAKNFGQRKKARSRREWLQRAVSRTGRPADSYHHGQPVAQSISSAGEHEHNRQ